MTPALDPRILKLRLDAALALLADDATHGAAVTAWIEAEEFEDADAERLLLEAVVAALGEDRGLLFALAHIVLACRESLTEARHALA